MNELTINMGPTGHAESIDFNRENFLEVGPNSELPEVSEVLLLLALHTAFKREETQVEELCPHLSKINQELAQKLGEALCNKGNYQTVIEHDGKEETVLNNDYWLVRIFGAPPRGDYLEGSRTGGKGDAWFTRNVKIIIVLEEGGSPSKEQLWKFYSNQLAVTMGMNRGVKVSILVRENKGSLSQTIIDSAQCVGELLNENRVSLEVSANYSCRFLVFWISSDREVHSLHPYSKHGDVSEVTEVSSTHSSLMIGRGIPFVIEPPDGIEACVFLADSNKFTKGFSVDAENILRRIVSEKMPQHLPLGPCFRSRAIYRKRKNTAERFRLDDESDDFSDMLNEIQRVFAGKAKTAHVFAVPHTSVA